MAGSDAANRKLIMEFMEAIERDDLARMTELADDDIVMEWPQSGERFRGKENALGAVRAQAERPEIVGEPRIVGSCDVWLLMMPLRYGTETHHYVGAFEVEGGRIRRSTEFFAAPFPANPARAAFLDRS